MTTKPTCWPPCGPRPRAALCDRADQRPDAGAADGAAGDRRLHQPARHHRQLDPAPYPARAGAAGLFDRRRRGRSDRGRSAVDLADRRAEDRDIDFPEGVLVGAVRKRRQVIRPGGDRIDEGDVIAIFAWRGRARGRTLMQVSIDFF